MCLAVPGKVLETSNDDGPMKTGKVAFAGIVKQISLALLPEAGVGDHVLVHAGFAIAMIDEESARLSLAYLDDMEEDVFEVIQS